MVGERVHRRTYSVDVAAPAGVVYGLIADTTQWPLFLTSTIHVERLDFDGVRDRFHTWAEVNGSVKSWLSHRTLDAGARRIDFHQEAPAGPAPSLGGRWTVEATAPDRSRLVLDHELTVADTRPEDTARMLQATDTTSTTELDRLKATAERWDRLDALLLSFEESVHVKGPAELVYDFLCGIADWPGRVPHVLRAEVTEEQPGVQVVRTETRSAGGPVRTAETVRICFPHAFRIVSKETTPGEPLQAHTTEWSVLPDENDVTVCAQHQVLLHEDPRTRTGTAAARAHVRDLLGGQSNTVLNLAKRHAETAIRTLRTGS
ncbi:SRPBCC family protein [Streptomyces sp. NPDC059851]|uniref:aromatase/cyclase n=1 Tax=Streptomyces sp. NPDC059851 TaxID=3346971 RepID=UPI00365A446E